MTRAYILSSLALSHSDMDTVSHIENIIERPIFCDSKRCFELLTVEIYVSLNHT